ncbi:DNA-binding PucR family transcriptional regulator [Bacillus mesophilus]|uniref:PucR C-terminal helix-turn-helix domain-containing protein n=1 Tax=Bacillus mesophilus TaxID=1808955 RepID=A0A6M0Q6T9_9BACI|nr:helix-turn-helix domain-containing protein [Bacillus mesophilus]MBM7659957.1 DNA-binding PucR family transcriptional regulator [Bacillus mesophilus]NEY70818.1 hypothetical protein [Bacillus mesophilus]
MIDKLKIQFPSLRVQDSLSLQEQYEYYRLENGLYLSILKDELTENDRTLLSVFLTPISTSNQNQSPQQTLWKNIFLNNDVTTIQSLSQQYDENSMFRLIHFYIQTEVDRIPFEEAVSSLSLIEPLVIWIGPNSGVIVEQIKQDMIQLEELIDLQNAITTDFYTDLYFYIGATFSVSNSIHDQYNWETRCFQLSKLKIKNKNIYRFYETIPYVLLKETSEDTTYKIESLVKDFSAEDLQSIKVYIENGLNVSLAAKKLFMHRNSLQYRVDKFIDKTGVDIKSFDGALVIYLAIISQN